MLDSASDKLGALRRDIRIVHDRLMTRMQRMLNNPDIAPYLQEPIITQRDGRYVLPLTADHKGKVKAIVHDQSSSGATLFVEPFAMVDQNNELRQLQLDERDEERRILAELSDSIAIHAGELAATVEILAELDLALARGKYAIALKASEPLLKDFEPRKSGNHPGVTVRLWQARHPLLDPDTVVPIDLALDPQTYTLLITGPNTGGKTVTLKTVGLLALMAQSGLHIPAQSGSEMSIFQAVYADIGDEQSIEQSLSTFSGHITNIIDILKRADNRSLVVIDELGAGTDPQEGAALARAILTNLLEKGITTLVATHYPELKAYAHGTPGIVNASVEFDLETLQPTYHLKAGLPGRSNALAIAKRLGLPDDLVAAARTQIDPADLKAEDLLDEIHRQRDLARQARAAAEGAQEEVEELRAQLSTRLEGVEDERRALLAEARAEAAEELADIQKEMRRLRKELARARQPLEALQPIQAAVEEVEEVVEEPVARREPDPQIAAAGPVRLGSRVRLLALDQVGVVTSLSTEEAEVQIGVLRVRTRLNELEAVGGPPPEEKPRREVPAQSGGADLSTPGVELDLRGQRVGDALIALARRLDSAFLAGVPFIRIIHGKGTGRLRQAVREALGGHPHVKEFEGGHEKEGGEGVTVAKLRG